jgi:predicted PurR-regulated permease PerM
VVGYVARDFLIPTAGAVVLALMLTPVANTLERLRLPASLAAALSVLLLTLLLAGLLAVAIPSISSWAEQAPFLTLTLERKLEGLRKSLAFMQEVTNRVEQAASAANTHAAQAQAEKVVVSQHSLLGTLASTTPAVVLQIGYAGALAFMLLAHRNTHRRQLLRIPVQFETRVRLARTMRDINDRVGHYLFSLAVIYSCVAVVAAIALALLGFPNAMVWGAVMGLAFHRVTARHARVREPALRAQHRGGVRHDRSPGLDVGADRRDRGGALADPAQHHRRAHAVTALARGDAGR